MGMRNMWAVAVCALGVHAGVASQQAEAVISFPPALNISEPQTLVMGNDVRITWDPDGVSATEGLLEVSMASGFAEHVPPGSLTFNAPTFDLSLVFDTVNSEVVSGSLLVGDDIANSGPVYFYSTLKPEFGSDGVGGFQFLFIQEAHAQLDPLYAGVGDTVGVLLSLNSSTSVDPDSEFGFNIGDDIGTFAKAFQVSAVPEPMTASLAAMGLGLLTIRGLSRRRQT